MALEEKTKAVSQFSVHPLKMCFSGLRRSGLLKITKAKPSSLQNETVRSTEGFLFAPSLAAVDKKEQRRGNLLIQMEPEIYSIFDSCILSYDGGYILHCIFQTERVYSAAQTPKNPIVTCAQ